MSDHVGGAQAELYNHTDKLLQGHLALLRDRARNQSFYRALEEIINKNSTVLDIGSGTGIWAVAAARLGAKRVVAVEYEPLLIGMIQTLAAENGVAEKVEVLLGDSRNILLDREFDVVISETIGHMVFDESIVSIMIDARERFLKPGGVMIPRSIELVAAAAHLESCSDDLPFGIPLSFPAFESLGINIPVGLRDISSLKILTAARTLIGADLMAIKVPPALNNLTASWEIPDAGEINCFAVWAEIVLSNDVSVTTSETTSWFPMVYRIDPFRHQRGEVRFDLTLTSISNYWTASITDGPHREEQSYSPALAAKQLVSLSKMGMEIFNEPEPIGQ